jgi:hypothetical protein
MARKTLFTQAHCTIVYSLKRSADKEFNDEITQLMTQVNKKNIQFADLNHYAMQKGIDQMVVVNKKGKILRRYSGSVTLVNALLDCG